MIAGDLRGERQVGAAVTGDVGRVRSAGSAVAGAGRARLGGPALDSEPCEDGDRPAFGTSH